MPCIHKFFGHPNHLPNEFGLIPNWDFNCLIIGTFNPQNLFAPNNNANYFYGRSQFFWKALPRFAGNPEIENQNLENQFNFLQSNKVGLTDLLIQINDADYQNPIHLNRIQSFQDNEIELFQNFEWNTDRIIEVLKKGKVSHVYFTKLGNINQINVGINTFENQIRIIENYCQNNNINHHRLHSPTGQGLGKGIPRIHKLINRWFNENGGNDFPFLSENFNINHFPFVI